MCIIDLSVLVADEIITDTATLEPKRNTYQSFPVSDGMCGIMLLRRRSKAQTCISTNGELCSDSLSERLLHVGLPC